MCFAADVSAAYASNEEQLGTALDQLAVKMRTFRREGLEALGAGEISLEGCRSAHELAVKSYDDECKAVDATASANLPAIFSHFNHSERQSILTIVALNLAGLLAWSSKRTSHKRFMLQHLMQRMPPARTAPYTLLTSAFSYPSRWPLGWIYLDVSIAVLVAGGQKVAHILGPFNFLAFYLSAAAASSLAGMPIRLCIR